MGVDLDLLITYESGLFFFFVGWLRNISSIFGGIGATSEYFLLKVCLYICKDEGRRDSAGEDVALVIFVIFNELPLKLDNFGCRKVVWVEAMWLGLLGAMLRFDLVKLVSKGDCLESC